MKKNILIRVDYLPINGLGHFVRQINLLYKLPSNFNFYFLSNNWKIKISDILNRNSQLVKISSLRNNKINQELDINQTLKYIKKLKCNFLIVDNYELSKKWYDSIYKKFDNILVFHDFLSKFRGKYIFNNTKKFKKSPNHFKINELGFLDKKIISKKIKKKDIIFSRICINFGSIDKFNLTEKVLDNIIKSKISYSKIDVFLGPFNMNKKKIKLKFVNNKNINYLDLNFYKRLDYKAGLFFGSAGITSLENLYLGKILFIIKSSINQTERLKYLRSKKNVYYLGSAINKNLNFNKFINKNFINNVITNYNFKFFNNMKITESYNHDKYIKLITNILI